MSNEGISHASELREDFIAETHPILDYTSAEFGLDANNHPVIYTCGKANGGYSISAISFASGTFSSSRVQNNVLSLPTCRNMRVRVGQPLRENQFGVRVAASMPATPVQAAHVQIYKLETDRNGLTTAPIFTPQHYQAPSDYDPNFMDYWYDDSFGTQTVFLAFRVNNSYQLWASNELSNGNLLRLDQITNNAVLHPLEMQSVQPLARPNSSGVEDDSIGVFGSSERGAAPYSLTYHSYYSNNRFWMAQNMASEIFDTYFTNVQPHLIDRAWTGIRTPNLHYFILDTENIIHWIQQTDGGYTFQHPPVFAPWVHLDPFGDGNYPSSMKVQCLSPSSFMLAIQDSHGNAWDFRWNSNGDLTRGGGFSNNPLLIGTQPLQGLTVGKTYDNRPLILGKSDDRSKLVLGVWSDDDGWLTYDIAVAATA